jgi:hypothetical protein
MNADLAGEKARLKAETVYPVSFFPVIALPDGGLDTMWGLKQNL